MPYNTRRKSLSLPSLGIQLPNASRVHRSNSKSNTPDEQSQLPPQKKLKRSHQDDGPPSPVSQTRSPAASPPAQTAQSPPQRIKLEHTPPPSPGDVQIGRKVDIEGINDDIVIAVIEQLEKTANRPHLIKDLATVLASTNHSIAQSANPAALLSSRLSLYLKRPWTALSPCPLAKELIPVHPRKVFFYLTTQTRMELPENSDDIIPPTLSEMKRLTPSISDPSVTGDEMDAEIRGRSPSPEVELFSPDFEDDTAVPTPPTPGEAFSGRSSLNPDGTPDIRARGNRAPSPALEADERGFTETATAVRARGMSLQSAAPQPTVEIDQSAIMEADETPEQQHKRDEKLADALFGYERLQANQKAMGSSPMMLPKPDPLAKSHPVLILDDIEMADVHDTLLSPEMIDVDELDSMFSGY